MSGHHEREAPSTHAGSYRYRLDVDERHSTAVPLAVSDLRQTPPTELAPLHRAIDPDALDHLFRSDGTGEVRVQFEYDGCRIDVTSEDVRVWATLVEE